MAAGGVRRIDSLDSLVHFSGILKPGIKFVFVLLLSILIYLE